MIYSTYLGGNGDEWHWGIALGPAGDTFVVGYTRSTDFPTVGPLHAERGGSQDGFIAKIVLRPTITPTTLSNTGFELGIVGQVGQTVILQGSMNLSDWIPLATLTNISGTISFRDVKSIDFPQRFYRTLLSSP